MHLVAERDFTDFAGSAARGENRSVLRLARMPRPVATPGTAGMMKSADVAVTEQIAMQM